MMKEAVRALETGGLAEVGLVAFLLAFVLIVIRTFLIPEKKRDDAKQIPLDEDADAFPPNGNN